MCRGHRTRGSHPGLFKFCSCGAMNSGREVSHAKSRNPIVLIWSVPTVSLLQGNAVNGDVQKSQSHRTHLVNSHGCYWLRVVGESLVVAIPPSPSGQFQPKHPRTWTTSAASSCRNPTVLIWSVPTSKKPETYFVCSMTDLLSQSRSLHLVSSNLRTSRPSGQ
jgi:hypothetical protein